MKEIKVNEWVLEKIDEAMEEIEDSLEWVFNNDDVQDDFQGRADELKSLLEKHFAEIVENNLRRYEREFRELTALERDTQIVMNALYPISQKDAERHLEEKTLSLCDRVFVFFIKFYRLFSSHSHCCASLSSSCNPSVMKANCGIVPLHCADLFKLWHEKTTVLSVGGLIFVEVVVILTT